MLEIERQRQDFNTLAEQFLSFKKQVGGLEETLGAFVESYYITKVVEEIRRRTGSLSIEVRKNIQVTSGEIDAVIITNGTVYALEVSGVVRREDVEKINVASVYLSKMSEFTGKSVKPIVAGVRFDRHALEEAKRLRGGSGLHLESYRIEEWFLESNTYKAHDFSTKHKNLFILKTHDISESDFTFGFIQN